MIRIGFWGIIIRSPQNRIGNYYDPYIIEPYYRSLIDPFQEPFKKAPK